MAALDMREARIDSSMPNSSEEAADITFVPDRKTPVHEFDGKTIIGCFVAVLFKRRGGGTANRLSLPAVN